MVVATPFSGSSPLTRGKRAHSLRLALQPGLIPAHAGKTPRQKRSPRGGRAHPRSRGENLGVPAPRIHAAGSSPLTRGKPWQYAVECRQERLIPAHAGKTITWVAQLITSWAHPRSRGENLMETDPTQAERGSSPLTRGKPDALTHTSCRERLIPAHAGKTSPPGSLRHDGSAHPRSRGENIHGCVDDDGAGGSSPLTRGKRQTVITQSAAGRLIPAHAGKTHSRQVPDARPAAHPRSRGENR